MRNICSIKPIFEPINALVVYKNKEPDYESQLCRYFVMNHEILTDGKIGAGRPLTERFINNIMKNRDEKCRYVDERVVMISTAVTVWWKPLSVEYLYFSPSTGIKSGRYPLPPMLFALKETNGHFTLFNFALSESKRPAPKTPVYHSPLLNVHADGRCCMGNVGVPTSYDISAWEKVYFGSTCTPDLLPTVNDNPKVLWNNLLDKTEFPVSKLVHYGKLDEIKFYN